MIKVNWLKIKPYEERKFALVAMAILLILGVAGIIVGFFSDCELLPFKYLTAIFIFLTIALDVKIESRMLQIYLLLGVLDVGLICAGLISVPSSLTIFLFFIALIALIVSAG